MKKVYLLASFCLGFTTVSFADTKRINVNTAVFSNKNISNQAIMDFGQNSITLGDVVWGAVERKSGNRFLAGVGAFWVYWGWFWNAHEFGHGTRQTALGMPSKFKPKYTYNFPRFYVETLFKPVNPAQNNLWAPTTGGTDELAYELGADNPYMTYTGSGANRVYTPTNRANALTHGAGFANDSLWAENLAERAYTEENVPVSTTVSYTLSKILPFFYTSQQGAGDVQHIADATGVSTNAIKQASLLSLALSTTTYSMWGAMINGEPYVRKQPTTYGLHMPDVSAYFTHGISYKINSGYTVTPKTHLPIAFETITQSNLQKSSEITIGAIHKFTDKTQINASTVYNLQQKGLSFASKIAQKINDTTTAYISAHQYDLNTLYGERNTTDFRKNKTTSIYLGVDVEF